jgi:dethiobiotin synthetase
MNAAPQDSAMERLSPFPARGLFVTGTDTDVGKTFVTAMIARKLVEEGQRVGVYKPVASGVRPGQFGDAEQIWDAAGQPGTLATVCPQRFAAPLAPHLSAQAEGAQVNEDLLIDGLRAWCDSEFMLVEGVGGLMSPVSEDLYCADLAEAFGYRLLIVVPNRLGCINQALQTLITAATFRDGLVIAGVVLNDVDPNGSDSSKTTNLDELLSRCQPPIVAHLSHGQPHSPAVKWMALAEGAPID